MRASGQLIIGLLLVATGISQTQASVFVGSRSALGGNDFIDWGSVGPAGTLLPNPFNITSNNGVPAIVSGFGNLYREDEGTSGPSIFPGNFAPGDHLLSESQIFGSIVIDLSSGIYGAGMQVETDQPNYNYTFSGTISAFDQNLNPISSFNFSGLANTNNDNSAVFAGILDSTPDIYRLVITANDQTGCAAFLINRLDLVEPVPEGQTASLLLIGGAFIGFICRRALRRPG